MKSGSKRSRSSGWQALVAVAGMTASVQPALASGACLRGINLAGAEFGEVGEAYGKGYIYPSAETIGYFSQKGFNTVRLPFLWERLQPKLYGAFDKNEAKRLADAVEAIRAGGMVTILDPHNYGRYNGTLIGSEEVPQSAFADFWRRLAMMFPQRPDIVFGLMNEPYGISAQDWLSSANSAISAIRQTGAINLVLVPGTAWTGAHSWLGGTYGTPNATVMANITDPQNNYAYEVHQYLDTDFSGKNDECSRAEDAVKALGSFASWLRSHRLRGFLGEFAVPRKPECQAALADMVNVVERSPDIWLGWSYWAAGEWWPAEEPLNIQPVNGEDRPQMQTLSRFFSEHSGCNQ